MEVKIKTAAMLRTAEIFYLNAEISASELGLLIQTLERGLTPKQIAEVSEIEEWFATELEHIRAEANERAERRSARAEAARERTAAERRRQKAELEGHPYPPWDSSTHYAARREHVLFLSQNGANGKEIGLRLDISPTRVHQILRQTERKKMSADVRKMPHSVNEKCKPTDNDES